ncbi:MAG: MarR family winged helix-turn-helix transcriptional regulator [Candidatus Limnocylindrales bacterium]
MLHVMATILERTAQAPPATASDPLQRIIADLNDSLGELRCAGSERLVRAGVSMTHLHLMWILQRHGELTMSHLAEMLDVSLSNATGLIDRMEERGLVARSRVPDDRRVVRVGLADHGRDMLQQVDILRGDLMQRILARLDERQLARLALAVGDLRDAIRAADKAGDLPPARHAHGSHGPIPDPAGSEAESRTQ